MRGQVRCFPPLTAWPIDGGDGAKLRHRREQQRIIIPKVDSLIGSHPAEGMLLLVVVHGADLRTDSPIFHL